MIYSYANWDKLGKTGGTYETYNKNSAVQGQSKRERMMSDESDHKDQSSDYQETSNSSSSSSNEGSDAVDEYNYNVNLSMIKRFIDW